MLTRRPVHRRRHVASHSVTAAAVQVHLLQHHVFVNPATTVNIQDTTNVVSLTVVNTANVTQGTPDALAAIDFIYLVLQTVMLVINSVAYVLVSITWQYAVGHNDLVCHLHSSLIGLLTFSKGSNSLHRILIIPRVEVTKGLVSNDYDSRNACHILVVTVNSNLTLFIVLLLLIN